MTTQGCDKSTVGIKRQWLFCHTAQFHALTEQCERSNVANTLKEMSVGLCRGNGMILAAGQKVLAKVTGYDVQPGLVHPRAELV